MAEITLHQIDGDESVCFHSAGHALALVIGALYEHGTGFDVELFGTAAAGEDPDTLQPIRAHKMILMHASKHLHELFTVDGYIDSHQTQYKLTEVDHETLSDIVKFTYTDKLNFEVDCVSERMQKVLGGAKFLIMPYLADACETYLVSDKHLNLQNCMCLLRLAKKYTCLTLLDATLTLAAQNMPHFIGNLDFLSLNENVVGKLLLSEPVITLANADQRCHAAVAWLNHDRPARDACVNNILNMVPFDLNNISLDTLAAIGNNTAIRTEYAEKFMSSIVDGVTKKYQRCSDQRRLSKKQAVADVWWNTAGSRNMWYVMGGYDAPTEFLSYDVTRRYWSKLPDLPWTRTFAGACALGNKTISLFGGCKTDNITADIDMYDLSTQEWTTSTEHLSAPRRNAGVCAGMYQKISSEQVTFICGGYPDETSRLMEKLHSREGDGKLLIDSQLTPEMSVGRYNVAAVYASDAIFVAGGRTQLNKIRLSNVDKFDCVANKWSTVGNMKCGGRSSVMAAVLGDDDWYLAGGFGAEGEVNTVEIFNIRTGQFRQAPNLLNARFSGSGVALDRNTFCVIEGAGSGSTTPPISTVETFDVREGKWTTGVVVPDMPTAKYGFSFACV